MNIPDLTTPLNTGLTARWSPYAIDPNKPVSESDVRALLEAARISASSYNAQPWRFVVGVRGRSDAVWQQIFGVLLESNQAWAKNAPVLMLAVVEHQFEHNGKPNKAAAYDLGAAANSLTFEATARGLSVHQMIGIDPDKARKTFDIGGSLEPFTGIAIGYLGEPDVIPEQYALRDAGKRTGERQRKPLAELLLAGSL